MKYRYRVWLHGLLNSVVDSATTSLIVFLVDQQDFNPFTGEGAAKLGSVALVSGLTSLRTYMKQHPLLNLEKDTDYYEVRSKKMEAIRKTEEPNR